MPTDRFIEFLLAQKLLQADTAATITAAAAEEQLTLITYLLQHKTIAYQPLAKALAEYFGLAIVDLAKINSNNLPLDLFAKELLLKYKIMPISAIAHQVYLGVADPSILDAVKNIKLLKPGNWEIKPVVVEYDKLTTFLDNICNSLALHADANDEEHQAINLTDQMIYDAIDLGSSDIHLEALPMQYRLRFRIDGLLHERLKIMPSLGIKIIARLKIMAGLDLAEKRLPQDGRFSFTTKQQKAFDCRVSTCPGIYGEKIVIRILNPEHTLLGLAELGLEAEQMTLLTEILRRPQGLILVTGPTGSGKSISLYAILAALNDISKNIVTIEDPVELNILGINQTNINNKIKLDFATALRAFLRQDPDIIMVGEIRDRETAEIAVRAAQTGHLVLATLHTNSAAEAITRLLNMGIATFNLANSLLLIIAQRLVRKLCQHCKKSVTNDSNGTLFVAQRCDNCIAGFKGRAGVFELLPISEAINQLLLNHGSTAEIEQAAHKAGMLDLSAAALLKVQNGITSMQEIQRVVY